MSHNNKCLQRILSSCVFHNLDVKRYIFGKSPSQAESTSAIYQFLKLCLHNHVLHIRFTTFPSKVAISEIGKGQVS